MFESDDFDLILSQLDVPSTTKNSEDKVITNSLNIQGGSLPIQFKNETTIRTINKRSLINNHFNHSNKRKFPGPAGMLSGTLVDNKCDNLNNIEIVSQDIIDSNTIHNDIFTSSIWRKCLNDFKESHLSDLDEIHDVKLKAGTKRLNRQKARALITIVDSIDRSISDPVLQLRDQSDTIQCTLHRDAWTTFSPYLTLETTILILWRPTVLTTGTTYKKHYLNITMSNILAIYTRSMFKPGGEEIELPSGYVKEECNGIIVVKMMSTPVNEESSVNSTLYNNENNLEELLAGLDESSFLDENI